MLNNNSLLEASLATEGDDFVRKLRLACSGCLAFLSCGAGLAQAEEQPVVLAVEVTGNHQVAETILRAVSNIRLGGIR